MKMILKALHMNSIASLIKVLVISFFAISVQAQQDSLSSIIKGFNTYKNQSFTEKLFVHTDKAVYLSGETLWFKIYCVDGTFHKPSDLSKVAYIELMNKDQKPVLQAKVKLEGGFGKGSFFMPASINAGNYVIRAYTHWMKNFDPAYFFQQPVTIINTFKPLGLAPVKDSLKYDIQLFPEGGNLVNGIPGKIAFKVTDRAGKGIDFKGFIVDQKNDTVARFSPFKYGIGSFLFTPLAGNQYKVIVKDLKKHILKSEFPTVYEKGYSMQLDDSDSLQLKITVQTAAIPSENVYLFIHTRQVIKHASRNFLQQEKATFIVNKNELNDGISHITVFNANKKPVCERLYFKPPASHLSINASADSSRYGLRKKIAIEISSVNKDQKPEASHMSVAVYLLDSIQKSPAAEISSHLWLASDLKGYIESADDYLTHNSHEAMDNLMLTHGWRRFKWEDILANSTSIDFIPEYKGHIINAKITDSLSNLPASGISAYLSSPNQIVRLYGSKSDKKGNSQFEVSDFYGPREIIVQTTSTMGRRYKIEVQPPFSQKGTSSYLPEFDLDPELKSLLSKRSIYVQAENIYTGKYNILLTPSVDSLPFYGIADERYRLDDFTRFKVMEDVLREYVPGVNVRKRKGKFHFTVHDRLNKDIFHDDPMVLLDGVPIFDIDSIMAFDPLKIKKLDVITQQYMLGPYAFNGIVSFITYKGDMAEQQLNMPWLRLDYEGLQLHREFYSPKYELAVENRLPDFRNLLYWSPEVITGTDGKQSIQFYTSDIEGRFLVSVQGITKSGLSGSKTFTFEVGGGK